MADQDYVVTAGGLVAKVPESQGGERYFYRGDFLVGVSKTECERLVDLGLAKEVKDESAPPTAKPSK